LLVLKSNGIASYGGTRTLLTLLLPYLADSFVTLKRMLYEKNNDGQRPCHLLTMDSLFHSSERQSHLYPIKFKYTEIGSKMKIMQRRLTSLMDSVANDYPATSVMAPVFVSLCFLQYLVDYKSPITLIALILLIAGYTGDRNSIPHWRR